MFLSCVADSRKMSLKMLFFANGGSLDKVSPGKLKLKQNYNRTFLFKAGFGENLI